MQPSNSNLTSRILIVGPAWVGDMVMAQSLFKKLRIDYPKSRLDVLAPAWTEPLLARMPEVSKAVMMPLGHGHFQLMTRWKIGKQLRRDKYTMAIVLPSSFKSALAPFFANIRQRTGFLGELRWGLLNDIRKLDKKLLPRTVDRFVALGDKNKIPVNNGKPEKPGRILQPKLVINEKNVRSVRERYKINNTPGPVLGLCPGAEYGPAKQWPAEYYADIAREKLAQGWQVWLFGSDKDVVVTKEINTLTQNQCMDLSGKTSLADAIDLMSCTDTIVTNDSGLMHVAAALDRKLIAIYGSTDPGFTPPLTDKAKIISLDLDCSPCFKRDCPLGHTKCLVDLKPERVLTAMDNI
ncbi:MAG: lipopolysaccharide heptosyltransferase II [Acidiferrobacterales bacterium]